MAWPTGRKHSEHARLLMASAKLGIDAYEIVERKQRGEHWCEGHRAWELLVEFGRDARESDGIAARCRVFNREATARRRARLA